MRLCIYMLKLLKLGFFALGGFYGFAVWGDLRTGHGSSIELLPYALPLGLLVYAGIELFQQTDAILEDRGYLVRWSPEMLQKVAKRAIIVWILSIVMALSSTMFVVFLFPTGGISVDPILRDLYFCGFEDGRGHYVGSVLKPLAGYSCTTASSAKWFLLLSLSIMLLSAFAWESKWFDIVLQRFNLAKGLRSLCPENWVDLLTAGTSFVLFLWDVVTSALGLVVSVGIKRVYKPVDGNILLQVLDDALSPEHKGLFVGFLIASVAMWTLLQCIPHHLARTIQEIEDDKPFDYSLLDEAIKNARVKCTPFFGQPVVKLCSSLNPH